MYGIRITVKGDRLLKSDSAYDGTLSIRRLMILTAAKSTKNSWAEWNEVYSFLNKAMSSIDSKVIQNQLSAPTSKLLEDVIWLREREYLDTASYKDPNGKLLKEKPLGMIFRD